MMITLIVLMTMVIVFLIVGFCFRLAGGVLKLAFKLLICLPCAILFGALGIALCCTLLLIPLGLLCFKLVGILLNPFRMCAV